MSCYSQYRATRKSWGINALGSMIVEVEAEDGTTGVGVTIAGEPGERHRSATGIYMYSCLRHQFAVPLLTAGCYIVENHLSRFIEGEDRATSRRCGTACTAPQSITAARASLCKQLAPWTWRCGTCWDDCEANQFIIYLAVSVATACPCTAPQLGRTLLRSWVLPAPRCRARTVRQKATLACAVTWPTFADWRRKVGPDFPLMLDCYMALSVPYSLRLAKALEPHGLRWLEEPLHPDDYPGYRRLADSLMASGSTVQLTCGEHEYSRYGFRDLIDGGVTVLQPDITWLGGITEARRVVAMAAARDAVVVPHGSSVYSYHLQMAFPNCPLGEFINLSPEADTVSPYFGNLFLDDEPLPERGFVRLAADRPGFGVTLNREDLRRPCEGRVMDEELPVVPF
uniref:MR_MLE domain-containing protein n=1 Tax=Macrostomum lignano TaxID=282301 RepID=A0A1I8JFT8_9PLAT